MFPLDEMDKKIIFLRVKDPEISQKKLGQILKISQPVVGARLHKLKKKNIIVNQIGLNLKKANIGIAKVDLSTSNSAEILELFKKCPLFINGFVTSGKRNLCLFMIAEQFESLNACMDRHVRTNCHVCDVEISIIISSANDVIAPIMLELNKTETKMCTEECDKCNFHTSETCLGCPNTKYYRGTLFR